MAGEARKKLTEKVAVYDAYARARKKVGKHIGTGQQHLKAPSASEVTWRKSAARRKARMDAKKKETDAKKTATLNKQKLAQTSAGTTAKAKMAAKIKALAGKKS